ncbi:MAG: histidine kinase [Tetrasphaera sp.]
MTPEPPSATGAPGDTSAGEGAAAPAAGPAPHTGASGSGASGDSGSGSGWSGPSGSSYWHQGPPDGGAPWATGLPEPRRPGRPELPPLQLPTGAVDLAREWWPEVLAVLIVVAVYWSMDVSGYYPSPGVSALMLLSAVAAGGSFRRVPGVGLLLLIVSFGVGLLTGAALFAQIATASIIVFGCARFGSRGLRWLSGTVVLLSPIAGLVALAAPHIDVLSRQWNAGAPFALPWDQIASQAAAPGMAWALLLVLPWTVGRFGRSLQLSREREESAQAQRELAERERGYAQQVAELKAGQAQLARDVHDVVGHSLAVILAQAQSAQYLGDDEVDKMRETLSNVATSARRSLQDVRHVLQPSPTGEQAPQTGLDALIDGVATAGNDVRRHVIGTPRPLPPDLEQVAYRVLQEMLTNALKHGRRSGPVWVEQEWPVDWRAAQLRISVRNLVESESTRPLPTAGPNASGGLGVDSMRYRLESVGGQLVTDVEPDAGGRVFTATAWLPLRSAEVTAEGQE